MVEYPIGSIQEINKNEIIYIDSNKNECRIDFAKCHKNWNKQYRRNLFQRLFRGNSKKCVGIRELLVEKPSYTFWTSEKIKFVFVKFNNEDKQEKYNIVCTIENRLMDYGWHTMDFC